MPAQLTTVQHIGLWNVLRARSWYGGVFTEQAVGQKYRRNPEDDRQTLTLEVVSQSGRHIYGPKVSLS